MVNNPQLSFVLPTRDREEWVGECLQSLLGQTLKDIEVIVVNDGSTDGTKEFLDWWAAKDNRVRVIHNETSLGAGPSRNIGCKEAKSEIIAVCDDDDCYPDERAEITVEYFKDNPDSELVNFGYLSVGYYNEIVEKFNGLQFDEKKFKETGEVTYFSNPTAAYRKKSAMDMGGYKKEVVNMTDDFQFLQSWINSGKKVDFMPGYYMAMHRVLPESMMSKMRGWHPDWAEKKRVTERIKV